MDRSTVAQNLRDDGWTRQEDLVLDVKKKDPVFWATRIHQCLNHEIDLQLTNRYEQQRDFRMYEGGEMPYDELAKANPKYQDLRTNFMRVAANYIISAAQNMEVVGRIYPADGHFIPDEFKKVAGAFDKRLMAIRQHVDWKSEWDKAIADAVVTGEAYLKEGLKLTDDGRRLEFYLRRVDYRNVWVDHMSEKPGLEDAGYLFNIKNVEITRAVARFPKMAKVIHDFAYQTNLRHTTDENIGYEITDLNPQVLYDAFTNREGGGFGNARVNIGEAYFKTFDMKTERPTIKTFNFLTDEGFSNVVILSQSDKYHRHNRIPYVRLTAARFRENNLPYSPMTRFRRGYERVMTSLMRTGVRMAASRALVWNVNEVTKHTEKSPAVINDEYKYELTTPAPVIKEYGPPGSIKIENLSVDLQKTTSMFEMLMRLSEIQAQVDPSLLGQETNVTAGIAMDMKREEALNSFPEFRTCIREAVRSMTERILSLAEEYDKALHYPAVIGDNGQPIPVRDGDETISGNRVKYHVDLQSGSRTIMREQAANVMAILQKMDPQTSQKFLPILIDMMRIPDGNHIKNMVIDMLMASGVSLPEGMLSEEQRKKQEAQAAESQRKQEMQFELAAETAASEIDLNEAKTVEAQAKAMETLASIGQEEAKQEKDETKASDGGKDQKLIETIKKEMEAVLSAGRGASGESGTSDEKSDTPKKAESKPPKSQA